MKRSFCLLAALATLSFSSCKYFHKDDDPGKPPVESNNWSYFPNSDETCPNYIKIGDVDVEGTQLTVEAKFINIPEGALCSPTPYPNSYDIISKHNSPADVNYLLRPNYAQITTSNGFFTTKQLPYDHNVAHHVAMVYDGAFLKFYLDGCVKDSVPATGQIVTNDYDARIGFMAVDVQGRSNQFFGYIDELRIWKTARSKENIKTYANSPISSPKTEQDLLAYYNFNKNFNNIQGNSKFDGVLKGKPEIAKPTVAEEVTLQECTVTTKINKWGYFPNSDETCPNYVQIGDADVSGYNLTVEAKFINIPEGILCSPTPYPNSYDIISKHNSSDDVNYLLRPNYAQINTTNGFFTTKKLAYDHQIPHHVAMVYDGAYLKFYLDGCVKDSVAATGQIITNNHNARIGFMAVDVPGRSNQFFGYIDELRIWKASRSKDKLKAFANSSLINPTGEVDLVAYYNFDENYKNIQGNSSFDGTVTGGTILKVPAVSQNPVLGTCQ